MTPAEAANAMDTARTYRVDNMITVNAPADTVKNIAQHSQGMRVNIVTYDTPGEYEVRDATILVADGEGISVLRTYPPGENTAQYIAWDNIERIELGN